ncbi:GH116 family glycosyl-hydrolase [Paenibacillus aceris]|uniref:Uncharacterized protein (DUF608 family) n=1 Tax=Paenibacillus aceris TaxID=869555 RepID=A0ABS4I707_9BACL|nr:GH116 family glycosyl-hydrolase [Paenibacillus aceris]MBP1966500.1 uncharacterized protein (DUF608 family) [Paenibacillus aceris]NHW39524.1 hypothetical protein [Paenibacillus aceris]
MKKRYVGVKTKEISFPLGGIGSGSIGLSGNGRLIDWEIMNRPNKRSFNGFSHFSIKAEKDGELVDARILNGDLQSPYIGEPVRGGNLHSGYGFGPESQTMAGMPHFQHTEFAGEFPLAEMTFRDPGFPGQIELMAFNPFIPLNDKDSSLPAAFFEWEIHNTTDALITYTLCLSISNPVPGEKGIQHQYAEALGEQGQNLHTLSLSSIQFDAEHPQFGDVCIATDADEVSHQNYWYRGGWCDALEMYWRDFTKPGKLKNRIYQVEALTNPRNKDTASLASHFSLQPGERRKVRFAICWNFPNMHNYWNPQTGGGNSWKNYYATLFKDSRSTAAYALSHWQRLLTETLAFKEALFAATLPEAVLEAVSANLSVLKTATSMRLTDGSFYGFEGCIEDSGCCEGSCTHVWNYAYAMPFLFPSLERSMRHLDFKYNQRADGRMSFRLMLPVGREAQNFRACADGQFGGVIKAYRDWKISGSTQWLAAQWPAIKQSIEYAWAQSNEDRWDPEQTGVLMGRQHHTLDMELFGPNSWLGGFYLAALKAGSEMAAHLGESSTAETYLCMFQNGKAWIDKHLFNGSYYVQQLDLSDQAMLRAFGDEETIQNYWNEEVQEIKYQIGEGCAIDQVVAQWHAHLCGLGEIFDPNQTRLTLKALYQHNFKKSMRSEANTWRLYALNDEAGLVICTWPEGTTKPAIPLTYNSETMTGFEYQAASHMIQEGLVEEGVSIVQAIRDRYDGEKRNPWNEIECGSNYARSMASYSLLHAFSGFVFNMAEGMIGFHPVVNGEDHFRTIWSLDQGWGIFELSADRILLEIKSGVLNLKRLKLPKSEVERTSDIRVSGEKVNFEVIGDEIHFLNGLALTAHQAVILT